MTGAGLIATDVALPALPPGLGPAAERFARNTLRKSKQTTAPICRLYSRFTTYLAAVSGLADPPRSMLTAEPLRATWMRSRRRGARRRRCARSALR